jgi:hypothetical protein
MHHASPSRHHFTSASALQRRFPLMTGSPQFTNAPHLQNYQITFG